MPEYNNIFGELPPDAIAEDNSFEELANESFEFEEMSSGRHLILADLEEQCIEASMLRHRISQEIGKVEDTFEAMHGGHLVKDAFVYGFVRTNKIGIYDVWLRNRDPRPDVSVPVILWKKRERQWHAPTEIPLREAFALEIDSKWQVVGGGDDHDNGYYLLQVVKTIEQGVCQACPDDRLGTVCLACPAR